MKISLSEKRTSMQGWARTATLADGRVFYVSVRRGKRVRIPYKPRVENVGFHWWAEVYEPATKNRSRSFRVSKSLGVRGILIDAGVIEGDYAPREEAAPRNGPWLPDLLDHSKVGTGPLR